MEIPFNYKKLDFVELGENYCLDMCTNNIYRICKKKLTLLKQHIVSGHYHVQFRNNGRHKNYYVHRLVYMAHFGIIPDDMMIDHIDRNPLNNDINNLRLSSRSLNCRNINHRRGLEYDYKIDIGESIVVNELDKVYYSKTYDKFYIWIENVFRSLHERLDPRYNAKFIEWKVNKKCTTFFTTHYRDNL